MKNLSEAGRVAAPAFCSLTGEESPNSAGQGAP